MTHTTTQEKSWEERFESKRLNGEFDFYSAKGTVDAKKILDFIVLELHQERQRFGREILEKLEKYQCGEHKKLKDFLTHLI